MMRHAYDLTKKILTEHNDKLVLVAETLLEREKITGEEFDSLMKTGALPVTEDEDASVEAQETGEEIIADNIESVETDSAETVSEAVENNDITEEDGQ